MRKNSKELWSQGSFWRGYNKQSPAIQPSSPVAQRSPALQSCPALHSSPVQSCPAVQHSPAQQSSPAQSCPAVQHSSPVQSSPAARRSSPVQSNAAAQHNSAWQPRSQIFDNSPFNLWRTVRFMASDAQTFSVLDFLKFHPKNGYKYTLMYKVISFLLTILLCIRHQNLHTKLWCILYYRVSFKELSLILHRNSYFCY